LFAVGKGKKLDRKRVDEFHIIVAKGLFACKHTRPDIQTAISVLCLHIKEPNEDDWGKLKQLLKYLNGTRNDVMTNCVLMTCM
jgi:hypothetical protein